MDLSRKERLLLWNQYSILEVLQPTEAKHYEKLKTILERGYRLDYDDLCLHIEDDEFPEEGALEVIRILAMFQVIQDSLGKIGGKVDGVDDWTLQFVGFDGNNEVEQLAYLRFLVRQQEKFEHVVQGRDFNSHAPLLGRYREMLALYRNLGSPPLLGIEHLKSLAGVWQRVGEQGA